MAASHAFANVFEEDDDDVCPSLCPMMCVRDVSIFSLGRYGTFVCTRGIQVLYELQ